MSEESGIEPRTVATMLLLEQNRYDSINGKLVGNNGFDTMHRHRYLIHANRLELYLESMNPPPPLLITGKYENFSRKDWTAWLLRVELLSKEVTVYLHV